MKKCNNCKKEIIGNNYSNKQNGDWVRYCIDCVAKVRKNYPDENYPNGMWIEWLVKENGTDAGYVVICAWCFEGIGDGGLEFHNDNCVYKQKRNEELGIPDDRERETILAYFKKHNIQSITLQGDNLLIKYQSSQTEIKPINTSKLQLIQSYCQKQGLTSLSLSDLQKQDTNTQKPFNWTPWLIGGGIALVIIIGAIIYFLTRKKEPSKNYEDWK